MTNIAELKAELKEKEKQIEIINKDNLGHNNWEYKINPHLLCLEAEISALKKGISAVEQRNKEEVPS